MYGGNEIVHIFNAHERTNERRRETHQGMTTDPSVFPLHMLSSIPSNALRGPGLVDVVHRDRGRLGLPAGQQAAAAGWRDVSFVAFFFLLRLGDVHFSRTAVTPLILHPTALNGPNGPKGLRSNKPKKKQGMIYPLGMYSERKLR